MNKKLIILVILLFCLPLFACSGDESPEPVAPAESPEINLPDISAEPTAAPDDPQSEANFVTTIDQITGTWIATADQGYFVAVISPDGMFRVASSSEEMEKGSTDSWKFTFEEDQIKATGYALCLGDTGIYLAEINPDGTLKFITISDPCTGRIRKMDRSLPGRLTPYDLIFHLVE
jgi:hypothetical protein